VIIKRNDEKDKEHDKDLSKNIVIIKARRKILSTFKWYH